MLSIKFPRVFCKNRDYCTGEEINQTALIISAFKRFGQKNCLNKGSLLGILLPIWIALHVY